MMATKSTPTSIPHTTYDVIIIGAGPAGYTAGIYCSRAGHRTLIISGVLPGGQLVNTTDVENYPGFEDGIMGPDLMNSMRQQTLRMGATIIDDTVRRVNFSGPLRVMSGGGTFEGRAVIVATGADPRKLGLAGEQTFGGRGVSYCATCDGPFFRDMDMIVVGGGDTAIEEATFLTKFARRVHVVHRRDKLRASKVMQERAFNNDKIRFIWNARITDIHGNEKVDAVTIQDIPSGRTMRMDTGAVFVAIGHRPNTELFNGQIRLDEDGYIMVEGTATSVPGVFAAGDVHDKRYRQAVTAAGYGCQAAIDADHYLTQKIV